MLIKNSFLLTCFSLLSFSLLSIPPQVYASEPNEIFTKEQKLQQIKLKQAEILLQQAKGNYDKSKSEFEEMKILKEKGIVTGAELSRAEQPFNAAKIAYEQAKLSLDETILSFLQDASYISVIKAKQYRSRDNKRMMKLILTNTSNIDQAKVFHKRISSQKELIALLKIENIYVSIKKDEVLIGQPYEIKIPSLDYGEEKTLIFELERDVEDVTVYLKYLQKEENKQIYLKKESAEDIVTISSMQFSQEGYLGESISYDLELERLAEDEKTFRIEVFTLPKEIQYEFIDPDTKALLSQVKFNKGSTTKKLGLKLYLPDKLPSNMLDKPVEFFAAVADKQSIIDLRKGKTRENIIASPKEFKERKIGYESLEIIPKGIGKLELYLNNLYYEIKEREEIDIKLKVLNKGTVSLSNIRITSDIPYLWEIAIEPETVKTLLPKQEATATLRVIPAKDIGVGSYNLKIYARCEYQNKPVEAEEKNISIHITSSTSIIGSTILILFLVALVVGVAILTVKISRR